MGVEASLKKDGIKVKEQLTKSQVDLIAKKVAQRIVKAFPNLSLNLGEIYIRLSQLNMYYAEVPKGMSQANYFYKNTSIYFNENMPFEGLEEYAVHECIHYLQERKDNTGFLVRMGICDLTQYNVHGLALNEAATQFATSKAFDKAPEEVKYYGITFETISPECYPLLCNLINQMTYITGEEVLLDSTFNSNDNFKNEFILRTSESAYKKIEKNFDEILKIEEKIILLNNKIEVSSNVNNSASNKVEKLKNQIQKKFMETQQIIMSTYFDMAFDKIENLEQIEIYRRSLYNFKNLVGYSEGVDLYNKYYTHTMDRLEAKYNKIEESVENNVENYYQNNVENIVGANMKNNVETNLENTAPNMETISNNANLPDTTKGKLTILFEKLKLMLFKDGKEYKRNE